MQQILTSKSPGQKARSGKFRWVSAEETPGALLCISYLPHLPQSHPRAMADVKDFLPQLELAGINSWTDIRHSDQVTDYLKDTHWTYGFKKEWVWKKGGLELQGSLSIPCWYMDLLHCSCQAVFLQKHLLQAI
jgi:hypothetical protein